MRDVQIMIDVETLAQSPNAVMCSIGAVKFSFERGITDTFYRTIDAKDAMSYGMVVEQDTLNWWKSKPKHVFERLNKNTVPLRQVLEEFSEWYGPKSLPTWACGASFDPPVVQWSYKAVGLERPWKFWHDRCYRTMRDLFKDVKEHEREGDHHDALDDAKHQALHLIRIMTT